MACSLTTSSRRRLSRNTQRHGMPALRLPTPLWTVDYGRTSAARCCADGSALTSQPNRGTSTSGRHACRRNTKLDLAHQQALDGEVAANNVYALRHVLSSKQV